MAAYDVDEALFEHGHGEAIARAAHLGALDWEKHINGVVTGGNLIVEWEKGEDQVVVRVIVRFLVRYL